MEIRVTKVTWDGNPALLASLRDITSRKRDEEYLEELVEDHSRKIDDLYVIARHANEAKSHFLSNISHELRTPLNSIIGFSEVLLDNLACPLTDEQRDLVKSILTSGKHLQLMIEEILDIADLETDEMVIEPRSFSLRSAVDSLLAIFDREAQKKDIELTAEIQEGIDVVVADEKRIRQVLFNLIGNALKFTRPGGRVVVRVRNGDSSVEVSVEDTGIGIAKEDFHKLFQPFRQIETSLAKKVPGAGIGLYLSKRIVELHGGEIRFDSVEGEGSTFTFSIPVRQVSP
ncbi:MAG: sensor histidine kinase [Promethearchaeota archaeon]